MPSTLTVDKDYHGTRFDKWFKKKVLDIPHSLIEKIVRQNKVKVNKKKIKSSYRVQEGDIIDIYEISKIKPKKIEQKIKYTSNKKELSEYENFVIEDNDNFLVINKPAGIPVQAGTNSFKNIIDILKETKYFEGTQPYIVHRLDKDTSGIFIIAKNRKYAQLLTSLFRIRKIHKTYLAITYGKVNNLKKNLQDNLIYYENNKKIIQNASTHLKVIKSNDFYSYIELKPITGRKHQLRKQLLILGNPIVGDDKYFLPKNRKFKIKSLLLHSYKLKFMINNIKYNFRAKYNDQFNTFLKKNF